MGGHGGGGWVEGWREGWGEGGGEGGGERQRVSDGGREKQEGSRRKAGRTAGGKLHCEKKRVSHLHM